MLTPAIISLLQTADSKALATFGPHGINVVPVSVLLVQDGMVLLYNFFMNKTVENIIENPEVALTVWKGLSGVQIKGMVEYVTDGPVFEAAAVEMLGRFPGRVLSGVLMITPTAVFDIGVVG